MADKVGFLTFFLLWARRQRWEVPLLHIRICRWLETCDAPERVLMVFRGAAKSTIYAIWKAYGLYRDPTKVSLIWAADDKLATKLTRDTINVLRHHPLCMGLLPRKPGAQSFWVSGATDARNPSMQAVGVGSNATGSRANDIDFDDVEVPKNIKTPEARLNLRMKIDDSAHIAVPGSQSTYIGTPHTHDSIYTELEEGGANVLKIPLFERHTRYTETTQRKRYAIGFPIDEDGLYVLAGIHKFAKLLVEGRDYRVVGKEVVFDKPPSVGVLDFYSGCAWPERFTRDDIEKRRRRTRTINGWDSQYQLEAKPVEEIRLDPAKIIPYECEIEIRHVNNSVTLWLGQAKIETVAMRWDPASGKLKSDVSSTGIVFQDETGRRYIHRVEQLLGEVATFDEISGKKIVGGQVWQLCDLIENFQIPCIVIETNGIGGFAPAVLKACLKQRKLQCGVKEEASVVNKAKRILEGLEPLLLSSGMLWAHVDVLDGPLWDQMKDWNPAAKNQEDDYIDVVAAACNDVPERVGKLVGNSAIRERKDWRPTAGVFEVETDH
jgi:hypothetical protein